MKLICIMIGALLAFSTTHAATPFNLDISRIKSCKMKFSVSSMETLLTVIQGLDEDDKVLVEFGDEKGNPIKTHEEVKIVKEYLVQQAICPEIK
jgi:hypothetical protein